MQTGGVVFAGQNQEEMVLFSQPVYQKEELKAPDNQWEGADGAVYGLRSWSIVEQKEEEKRENIKQEVICYGVGSADEIPDTCQISSRDSRTGSPVITAGKKVRETLLEEWWMEESGITLVCYLNREDRSFRPETAAVYNAQEPPAEECRRLLSEMGISPGDYQLEQVVWDGEILESPDGFLCRRIKAVGRRRVKDYQVAYEGTAVYPEVTSYCWRASYVREEDEGKEETEGEEAEGEEADAQGSRTGQTSAGQAGAGPAGEEKADAENKPLWGGKNRLWAEGSRQVRYLVRRITEIRIPLLLLATPLIFIWRMISFWRRKKK